MLDLVHLISNIYRDLCDHDVKTKPTLEIFQKHQIKIKKNQ